MNKHKHQLLWLMLPAVLIAAYFVVFQPGLNNPGVTTEPQAGNAVASQSRIDETESGQSNLADAPASQAAIPWGEQEEVDRDREFINYAFPLLSTWKLQELKPLLAEETIAASSDEELNEVMSVLEDRLGELKSFETPRPVPLDGELPDQDQALDGELQHYQFIAYYEAGEAEIDLILHKNQNDSSLYSFNIHVPNQEENVF